jgi:predicted transcriptional regulator
MESTETTSKCLNAAIVQGRGEKMATYTINRTYPLLASRKKYNLSMLPLGKKYRGHFEIIALILEAAKDGGEGRFAIMRHASVNCSQLEKFLRSLIEMRFIEVYGKEGRILCRATEKGLAFLREYYVLLGMLVTAPTQNNIPNIICEAQVRY